MKNTTSRGRVSQTHNANTQAKVSQIHNANSQNRISQTHGISSQSRVSQANASSQIHKAVAGKIPSTANTTPSKAPNTAKTTNAISKTPSISKALKALVFSAFALNFAAAVELNTICTSGVGGGLVI